MRIKNKDGHKYNAFLRDVEIITRKNYYSLFEKTDILGYKLFHVSGYEKHTSLVNKTMFDNSQ